MCSVAPELSQFPLKLSSWHSIVLPSSEGVSINKIEEQPGKAKVIDEDPTQKYTRKIQKHLCKLRKEKKYFEIYPSDPISPRLYGTVKAHKPEKNYPCVLLYQQLEHHPMEFQVFGKNNPTHTKQKST